MPVDPGHRLGQLVRASQHPSPRAGPPLDVDEGDVADDRGAGQLPGARPQPGRCGQVAVLAGVDPEHPAPGGFPGSFLGGLEPGNDAPRPGIPDTDHAGGFGGHRALAQGGGARPRCPGGGQAAGCAKTGAGPAFAEISACFVLSSVFQRVSVNHSGRPAQPQKNNGASGMVRQNRIPMITPR